MSTKNTSDTVGNPARDLPTCSAVAQPTAPPGAPIWQHGNIKTERVGLLHQHLGANIINRHGIRQSYHTRIHAAGGIRTRIPSKQAAAHTRLKPAVQRDDVDFTYLN